MSSPYPAGGHSPTGGQPVYGGQPSPAGNPAPYGQPDPSTGQHPQFQGSAPGQGGASGQGQFQGGAPGQGGAPAPGPYGAPQGGPGYGAPQMPKPQKPAGPGIIGPYTLRDLLLWIAGLLALVGMAVPYRRIDYGFGSLDSWWVWNSGWSAIAFVLTFILLPLFAVVALTFLGKSGAVKRIGSFGVDQVISVLTSVVFAYMFVSLITSAQYWHAGSYLFLVASLLGLVAGTLTMIPPFSAEFAQRPAAEAHPKARAHAAGAPAPAGQQGGFAGAPGPQGPAYGSQAPAPAYGSGAPAYGAPAPAHGSPGAPAGSQAPAYGSQAPAYGSQGAPAGSQGPAFGSQGPAYGSQGPAYGSQGPAFDASAPAQGFGSASQGAFGADDSSAAAPVGAESTGFGSPAGDHEATQHLDPVDASFEGQADSGLAADSSDQDADAASDVPAYGSDAPTYGAEASAFGAAAPDYGSGASAFGAAAPAYGSGAPAYGSGAPAYGSGAPPHGAEAPAAESEVAPSASESLAPEPAVDAAPTPDAATGSEAQQISYATSHLDHQTREAESVEPTQAFHSPFSHTAEEPSTPGRHEAPADAGSPEVSDEEATQLHRLPHQEESAEAAPSAEASQPFWFAVPEARSAFDPLTGALLFTIQPGSWFLALQDNGDRFTVRDESGQVAELRDISGIQRG